MDKINEWLVKTIGENTPAILLFVAAGLLVVLILTFVIVGLCHGKNKKKLAAAKEAQRAQDDGSSDEYAPVDQIDEEELRSRIRAELEPQIRAELEQSAASVDQATDEGAQQQILAMSYKIDELNDAVREKQNRIDELTAALESAQSADQPDNSDLYRTINELDQTVKEQANEINLLKAENSQIKAQALQQQLAERRSQRPSVSRTESARAETTATSDAAQQRASVRPTPRPEPKPVTQEPIPDEEDEYDEYYDDYGDASSAVKVTLKFDRLKNNWIILRSDTDRTYRRLDTKQQALVVAKDLARRLHAQLVVHKKDGKFQRI